jgi:hypothetical protein
VQWHRHESKCILVSNVYFSLAPRDLAEKEEGSELEQMQGAPEHELLVSSCKIGHRAEELTDSGTQVQSGQPEVVLLGRTVEHRR